MADDAKRRCLVVVGVVVLSGNLREKKSYREKDAVFSSKSRSDSLEGDEVTGITLPLESALGGGVAGRKTLVIVGV